VFTSIFHIKQFFYDVFVWARSRALNSKNCGFWPGQPFVCDGIYAADLNITSANAAGNTDGIHPDSSRNMLVERVHVSVGDDAVAITSGEMYQGRRYAMPSENMVFRDSVFLHRFFAIGSGTAAGVWIVIVEHLSDDEVFSTACSRYGATKDEARLAQVRNVTVENCQMGALPTDGFGARYGPSDDAGINIKTERGNGGWIEDIVFRNINIVGRVGEWDLLPATPIRVALVYAYNDSVRLGLGRIVVSEVPIILVNLV
jgi:polygalacturonase